MSFKKDPVSRTLVLFKRPFLGFSRISTLFIPCWLDDQGWNISIVFTVYFKIGVIFSQIALIREMETILQGQYIQSVSYNPQIPKSDKYKSSSYNFTTSPGKQVTRIKNSILSASGPRLSYQNILFDSVCHIILMMLIKSSSLVILS